MASVAVKNFLCQTSKCGAYKVCTNKDRCSIGKYVSCHRMAASVRARKMTYPNLNESTLRGFKKRYETKLKEASCKNVSPKKKLSNKMSGRPTIHGQKLETLVRKFLRATRYKGRVVNTQTALATTKALEKDTHCLKREISSYVHLGKRVCFAVWVLFCAERLQQKC